MFNILRNCPVVLCSGCTILHSHQQYMRVPVPPCLCQYLAWSVFLILIIPKGVHAKIFVGLIRISLMINYVEALFLCLIAIQYIFCLSVQISCPFLKNLLCFVSSLYIPDMRSYICLTDISSQSVTVFPLLCLLKGRHF